MGMNPLRGACTRVRLLRLGAAVVLCTGTLLQLTAVSTADAQPTRTMPQSLMVRGYLVARVGGAEATAVAVRRLPVREVYLPGIAVTLVDVASGTVQDNLRTDLSGRFSLYGQKAGKFQVCWKQPGFVAGCTPVFALGYQPQSLSKVFVGVAREKNFVTAVGSVSRADGSSTRTFDPVANINAFTTVTLVGGGRKLYETFVNNHGDYLVPQVPVGGNVALVARIEGDSFEQKILPESELQRSPLVVYDLRMHNSPPVLEPVGAFDTASQKPVQVAAPGATIELRATARDADGDPISYSWELPSGSGTLSDPLSATTKWTLPNRAASYQITAIAWDRKGGYARMPLLVRGDGGGAAFAGRVQDTHDVPIVHADVEINGQHGLSDAQGAVAMQVPVADTYLFNIHAAGRAPYSKVYSRGTTGGLWTLTGATVLTVDPTQPIVVTDRRKPDDCPGPKFGRLDWRTYRTQFQPQWQDGKGNVIFPAGTGKRVVKGGRRPVASEVAAPPMPWDFPRGKCGPGLSVSIPANSLVDEGGNAPTGKVQVTLSTVDLRSPEQMPGDFTVTVPGGTQVMQSFGAGSVEISAGRHRYNLRPGTRNASVTIPVDPMQLAAGGPIAPTIPVIYYDEAVGTWHQDATATLQGTGNARVYKLANAPHFSFINGDTLKTDQACVRILSPQPGMPTSYNMEVIIPQPNGNAPKFLSGLFSNGSPSEHVIYNLPTHTNIVLVPTHVSGSTTPIGVYVVNTGDKQNPTVPNHPAGPIYAACATTVTLSPQAVHLLPNSPDEFLQGLSHFYATNLGELSPANPADTALSTAINTVTGQYYAQVDPRQKRATLLQFRQTNGFADAAGNPITAGVVNTKYANSGDLGFGRDMYCKTQATPADAEGAHDDGHPDFACYVSNYGDVTTDDQADANAAAAGGTPIATVAMEYSRIESATGSPTEYDDPERTTKFFVFDGAGNPQRAANLDGHGARPVPQLCMVCHGGALPHAQTIVSGSPVPVFASRDDVKLQARFVAFDLRYFTFPTTPSGLEKSNSLVQSRFKSLNIDIVRGVSTAIGPDAQAITEVVDGMYTNGTVATQLENFAVPGWSAPAAPEAAKAAFYKGTVAGACRMCHTSQIIPSLRFDTAGGFISNLSAIGSRVCQQNVMPHAQRTHEIFWGIDNPTDSIAPPNPSMVAQLEIFGTQFGPASDWVGTAAIPPTFACGTSYNHGGTTPLSYYQATIQPLWSSYGCTGCHGSAGGLTLSGASWANLVNVASGELASMKYVAPNDSAHSYLYHKTQGDSTMAAGTSRMPAIGTCSGGTTSGCVNAADTATLLDWIVNRGADGP